MVWDCRKPPSSLAVGCVCRRNARGNSFASGNCGRVRHWFLAIARSSHRGTGAVVTPGFGGWAMRRCGCRLNDLYDRRRQDVDARNASAGPTRAILRGRQIASSTVGVLRQCRVSGVFRRSPCDAHGCCRRRDGLSGPGRRSNVRGSDSRCLVADSWVVPAFENSLLPFERRRSRLRSKCSGGAVENACVDAGHVFPTSVRGRGSAR